MSPLLFHRAHRALLFAVCLLLAGPAWSDAGCVRPSDSVRSAVMFRAGPSTDTEVLGRFVPGEMTLLEEDVPGWYQVRGPEGRSAFVSKRWTDAVECPASMEPAGAATVAGPFEVHTFDVGTGLAIFVRGPDFALLYDAGSNDDLAKGERNRVLAYLRHVDPALTRIDHVLLSHPHQDHVQLMADVFKAYEVGEVWNSGAYNEICSYRLFLQAIAAEPDVVYHSATFDEAEETISFPERCQQPASELVLTHGPAIGPEPVSLGEGATMRILHADGQTHTDLNDNSLIARLDLGNHRVLLVGDAGGGSRLAPTSPARSDSIEGLLVACCQAELLSDVLIAGHHGSKTSSRTVFLDAVGARHFVVSSGPKKYSGTMLPDREVIEEFSSRGKVWRTDLDDAACAVALDKIGETDDGRPGGCHNIVVRIDEAGIDVRYEPHP